MPELDEPAVTWGFVWLPHDRLVMVRLLYLIMVRVFDRLALLLEASDQGARSCSCYGMKSPWSAVRSIGHGRPGRIKRCWPR
jgi:hypothetical protein